VRVLIVVFLRKVEKVSPPIRSKSRRDSPDKFSRHSNPEDVFFPNIHFYDKQTPPDRYLRGTLRKQTVNKSETKRPDASFDGREVLV
jgi:hypothetical protein